MSPLTFFAALALLLCLLDWRKGVLIMVAVGFLADPIRKLIPEQPVAVTVLVVLFAAASLVGGTRARGAALLRDLALRYRRAVLPLQLFLVWVTFAATMTVFNFGSLILAGIGAVAYLAPLPGLVLAYNYASSRAHVERYFRLYVFFCLCMSSGIFLNFAGIDWAVLKGIGMEMYISDLGLAYPGFFRTTEVAAWHIGAAVCLIVLLAVAAQRPAPRWLSAAVIVFLMIAGLMTGRRKMLAHIMLFGAFYGLLLAYYRGTARRLVTVGLAVVIIGGLISTELIERSQIATERPTFERYLERGSTVFEDAPERLQKLGLGSVVWALRRHGWMGSGAGVSSQGAQHFGGGAELVGGAGEGGLGKIVVELGLPGLAIGLWLLLALGRIVSSAIARLARDEPSRANLACGMAAFLGAQVPNFVAASQVYGDPFVLIILGSVLGFLLATPALARAPAYTAYPPAGAVPPMAHADPQAFR